MHKPRRLIFDPSNFLCFYEAGNTLKINDGFFRHFDKSDGKVTEGLRVHRLFPVFLLDLINPPWGESDHICDLADGSAGGNHVLHEVLVCL